MFKVQALFFSQKCNEMYKRLTITIHKNDSVVPAEPKLSYRNVVFYIFIVIVFSNQSELE